MPAAAAAAAAEAAPLRPAKALLPPLELLRPPLALPPRELAALLAPADTTFIVFDAVVLDRSRYLGVVCSRAAVSLEGPSQASTKSGRIGACLNAVRAALRLAGVAGRLSQNRDEPKLPRRLLMQSAVRAC